MGRKPFIQLVHFFTLCLPIAFTFPTDVRSRLEKKSKILKCSSGHVKCIFDKPAENFLPKFRKQLLNYIFFKKNPQTVLLEETVLKKHFHLFKRHFQQNWSAEKMPLLIGRLVFIGRED